MSEWISVKDELPKQHGTKVLAICKYDGCSTFFYDVVHFWKTRGFEHPVIYWMPLPEAPED